MPKKEDTQMKIKGLLEEQCGDDAELYAFLCHALYEDPIAAISKKDLATLIEEAEESIRSENHRDTMLKCQSAVDKAIFEATQNLEEKSRYIRVIRDLAPKTAKVIEKVKEKAENEGLAERANRLERAIRNYEFLSERIEDVIRIASLYYNERLQKLKEMEMQAATEREKYERRETAKTIEKVKENADRKADMEGRVAREGHPGTVTHG